MEFKSSPSCPYTTTVRRNPHRKARPTPATNAPPAPISSNLHDIPSFPIDDILTIEIPQPTPSSSTENTSSQNLKVFLRIRPLKPLQGSGKLGDHVSKARTKNAWPQNPQAKNAAKEKKSNNDKKKKESCIVVNDWRSITLSPPLALQDSKRVKSEVYEGFSHVFAADSSQDEVYTRMVNPLVEDFLRGKSGMFAALGPSGSGKTHTVFGCPREPGMVPLILRHIFNQTDGVNSETPRSFFISMFEICSEKGKGERISDLLPDGGDICVQQSTIKGLQELTISDVAEAESLIARGMLRRATAMTNSNSQSSRSQCIINIRSALKLFNGEAECQSTNAVLTIVDLAGAEREKRTGNKGARLLESNFINNTSMVFGLCLRSLLEHQKNPKKPMQKHFQNSLLTRYLRDYLEGKKRMTLILTVKSGEEDYLDTSYLLRQASPYMKIKFNVVEKPSNMHPNKRQFQTFPQFEQPKRVKISGVAAHEIEDGKTAGNEHQPSGEGCLEGNKITPEKLKEVEPVSVLLQSPEVVKMNTDYNVRSKSEYKLQKMERNEQIMQNFAKALWNVLKEYKSKLEVAENEAYRLRESLRVEKERYSELEKEMNDFKSCCSYSKGISVEGVSVEKYTNSDNERESGTTDRSPGVDNASCLCAEDFNQQNQKHETFGVVENVDNFDELKILGIEDNCPNAEEQTGSRPSEVVVSSSKSLVKVRDDSSLSAKVDQLKTEQDEKLMDPLLSPKEDKAFTQECKDDNVQEREDKLTSSCKLMDVKKPKEDKAFTQECKDGNVQEREEKLTSSCKPMDVKKPKEDKAFTQECEDDNVQEREEKLTSSYKPMNVKKPKEDKAFTQECEDDNVQEREEKLTSSYKPMNVKKPKRRLLPASSILLRDTSSLGFEDENDRPKGNRVVKKSNADERNMTQGSVSLLRLLQSNLHL